MQNLSVEFDTTLTVEDWLEMAELKQILGVFQQAIKVCEGGIEKFTISEVIPLLSTLISKLVLRVT